MKVVPVSNFLLARVKLFRLKSVEDGPRKSSALFLPMIDAMIHFVARKIG